MGIAPGVKAVAWITVLVLVMAAVLFVSAGTLMYWQAWTFLSIYFSLSLATVLYLARRDPALLHRRMRGGASAEKEPAQRIIMAWTSLGFIGLLIIPALDHRFGWSQVPPAIDLAGDVLIALGWLAVFIVLKANTFASATVELTPGQVVISTGPYAVVRHPMYFGALLFLSGIPIALGSWWGLLVIAGIKPAIVWRLLDEERFLAKNLPGYSDYQRAVPYRLVPRVW